MELFRCKVGRYKEKMTINGAELNGMREFGIIEGRIEIGEMGSCSI